MHESTQQKLALYESPICGYCHVTKRAIKNLGLDVEMRNIMNAEHRRELVQEGGKQQVPCLRIEKGGQVQWLYESADIIQFLKTL